jgi:hypothetical protein
MNLDDEIKKFKDIIITKYKTNKSNLIYLRLSSVDNTQDNPIQDTLNKFNGDFNSLLDKYPNLKQDGFILFVEVKSAYKNTVRDEFISLYENYLFKGITIKDILENNVKDKEPVNLYISAFDRISRVFFFSLIFQLIRKVCNVNIYSLKQNEVDLEEKYKEIQDNSNQEQLLYVFQLMMFSSMASQHSEDMSYKIKKRTEVKNGITISNKTGNKWGRRQTISNSMKKKIISKHEQGFTYKEISEQTDIYQLDKDKQKKPISLHTIKSIVQGQ